jgi:predicted metal-dependent peptidase
MAQDTLLIDKLITARIGLLLKAPFFGNMATRMKIVDATDWCPTAATDGRNFFYNRDFVSKLSIKKLEFLFGHEILHCVFDHFGRLGSRDPKLANIAQDYAVNQILVDERIGEKITEVNICYDAKYRGQAWEEIYDSLFGQAQKITMKELLKQLGDQLDEHLSQDNGAGNGNTDGDGSKDGQGRPVISKADAQAIRDEIKEAMLQSAAAAGAGKTPAGVMRLIKDLTEPKIDWRQLIRQEIQSIIRNDYSFTRPNRKAAHCGAILPGMKEDVTIDVAIAIDMSGSIGIEDATAFISEVKGIMDQYQDFKINMWCFDTKVLAHQEFTADNSEDLLDYQPKGGGGTCFDCNFDWMKEMGITPKKFIMFTDGYPNGSWGDPDYTDTIFVIKGNQQAKSPYGETVIYEKS